MLGPPPGSALFPSTTLFRSVVAAAVVQSVAPRPAGEGVVAGAGQEVVVAVVADQRVVAGNAVRGVVARCSDDRASARLHSSHVGVSYAVLCFEARRPIRLGG